MHTKLDISCNEDKINKVVIKIKVKLQKVTLP